MEVTAPQPEAGTFKGITDYRAGSSRWESAPERARRCLDEHADLIKEQFPDGGYSVHRLQLPAFCSVCIILSGDPELKCQDSFWTKLIRTVREKLPDFRVKFATRPYYSTYERWSPAKGDPIMGCTVDPSAPLVVQSDKIGTGLLLFAQTSFPQTSDNDTQLLLVPAEVGPTQVAEFFALFKKIHNDATRAGRSITVYGQNEGVSIAEQSWTTWDRVFLDPRAATAVRDDLVFFVENEAKFREAELPYKRGYLLHGPPGNGKSTICRAIATCMPFASFAFDFSNMEFGNKELAQAFKNAAAAAPSVFFLEDIDRIWSHMDGENRTKITLDHLLNCIDGISPNDGLVVVATANNPKSLDPAILSRPGRFDAVVELGNPDYDLRLRYLAWLFRKTKLDQLGLARLAETTEGVSMAYVKEVFVLAMKSAFKNKRELQFSDAEVAVEQVMSMFNGISSSSRRKAGFAE